jgi:hypothetical protein
MLDDMIRLGADAHQQPQRERDKREADPIG